MDKEKIILMGEFNGQTTKKDGLMDIKFQFVSDELLSCLSIFKFVGKPIDLAIKIDKEVLTLGQVILSGFSTDKDARVKIKFTGDSASLDVTKLTTEAIGKIIKVRVQDV